MVQERIDQGTPKCIVVAVFDYIPGNPARPIELAIITLHETFPLGKIECDAEDLLFKLEDSGSSAHYFANWNSAVQSGAKMSIDMTVEKVS